MKEVKKWNGLLGCKGEPMNDDTTKLFLQLMMTEMGIQSGKTSPDVLKEMDEGLKGHFPYQVLKTRLEAFKKRCSPTMDVGVLPQIFCGLISNSPGKSVPQKVKP